MSHPQRPVRPSVDELFEAFPGRIYRPEAGRDVTFAPGWGWGGSSPQVTSLQLEFAVGSGGERIWVAVGAPRALPYMDLLIELVAGIADRSVPRFPLVIEREKQRIRVAGRHRVFTVLAAADTAVATTRAGDFALTIRCRRERLAQLELRTIEPDELRAAPQFRPGAAD